MTNKQTWIVTGAGRGMGVDIARAALDAGYAVVATARDSATNRSNPGQSIVLYTAEPGSPSQEALNLLASWTSTAHAEPPVASTEAGTPQAPEP